MYSRLKTINSGTMYLGGQREDRPDIDLVRLFPLHLLLEILLIQKTLVPVDCSWKDE